MRKWLVAVILGVAFAYVVTRMPSMTPKPVTPSAAIAYVKQQLGKPYRWGAAGPSAFDCSGLVQQAYHWGAGLRTSQQQWADLPHVDRPARGDLVFFQGAAAYKGEQPPGHVGIVISSRKMIDAYAAGFPVEYDSFGTPGSKQGLQVVWGYASP